MCRNDAQNHIEDLQSDLLEATTTVTLLEHNYQTAQVTIKRLEESRDQYRELLEGAQGSIDQLEQDKDSNIMQNRSLKRELEEVKSQMKIEKDVISSLESINRKLEAEKEVAVVDCGELRKSLLFAEDSLTTLSLEHCSLQKSLTEIQQEANELKGQLCSCKATNAKMEKQIDNGEMTIEELKGKLTVTTCANDSKDEEIENMRNVLNSVKDEKEKLQLSLAHLEEISVNQNQESSSTIACLRMSQQEMKEQKEKLMTTVNKHVLSLELEKKNLENLQGELEALKQEKIFKDLELEKTIEMHQNACATYNHLGAVLMGCFNDDFEETIGEEETIEEENAVKPLDVQPPVILAKLKPLKISKVILAIRQLQSTNIEQQTSNTKLEEEIISLQKQLQISKSQLLSHEHEIAELNSSFNSLKSAYGNSLSAKTEMDGVVASRNNQIKDQQSRIESLIKESDKLKNELETSHLDVHANEVCISTLRQELLEKEVEKTKIIGKLKEAQTAQQECECKNDDLKKNVNYLQHQMQVKGKEITELSERTHSLRNSLKLTEKKVTAAQSEAKGLKNSLKSSMESNYKIELKSQSCAKESREMESKFQDLSDKLATISKELHKSQQSEKNLKEQIELMRESKSQQEENLKKITSQLQEKVENLEGSVIESESIAMSLKATADKLTSEKMLIEEKLCKYSISEKELQVENEKLENALQSEKITRNVGDELFKSAQKENEKLRKSLQEARDKGMQIEEELRIALEHGQVAQDVFAKQSQQTKQLSAITQKNVELTSQVRELERQAFRQQQMHAQE